MRLETRTATWSCAPTGCRNHVNFPGRPASRCRGGHQERESEASGAAIFPISRLARRSLYRTRGVASAWRVGSSRIDVGGPLGGDRESLRLSAHVAVISSSRTPPRAQVGSGTADDVDRSSDGSRDRWISGSGLTVAAAAGACSLLAPSSTILRAWRPSGEPFQCVERSIGAWGGLSRAAPTLRVRRSGY